MEEDIFLELSVTHPTKTYPKLTKSQDNLRAPEYNSKRVEKRVPLTTKNAMKYLLEGKLKSIVCRYCLNVAPLLSELDQILHVAGADTGVTYQVTIRDMVASFHPVQVAEDLNLPDKICNKCVDLAISAYLFSQQCERAERALRNCLNDVYNKLEKLDPLERTKKRGRQKLKPNHNVICAEHERVIDYAEPIINIVNLGARSMTEEPEMTDLECKRCWQVLPNQESLLNHEKTHPSSMWYHCRLCGKSFPKCQQLKKHYHRVHVLGKEPPMSVVKNFKCNECEQVNDNYKQHLQHMEKHKFKVVMEHVIGKKMDNLCMVCLDKSPSLVDMEKMVCIHGGYPELTGDRTLQSIIASTLPHQKLYKYQELYVPKHANIMKIVKKRNKSTCIQNITNIHPLEDMNIKTKTVQTFILSDPMIIAKEDVPNTDLYVFMFPKPEVHMDELDSIDLKDSNESIVNGDINLEKGNSRFDRVKAYEKNALKNESLTNNNLDNSTDLNTRFKIHEMKKNEFIQYHSSVLSDEYSAEILEPPPKKYKFSNPDMEIDKDTKSDDCHVNNDIILCNNCWIFDKALCARCKLNFSTKSESTNGNDDAEDERSTEIYSDTKDCKYCWVFKHLDKCNYCKKPIIKPPFNNTSKNIEKINDIGIMHDNSTSFYKDLNNIEPIYKNLDYIEGVKPKTWHCAICLTSNNRNRFNCACCESVHNSSTFKINFGKNTSFISSMKQNNVFNDTKKDNEFNSSLANEEQMNVIDKNQINVLSLWKQNDIEVFDDSRTQSLSDEEKKTILNTETSRIMEKPPSTSHMHSDEMVNVTVNFNAIKNSFQSMEIEHHALQNSIQGSPFKNDLVQMEIEEDSSNILIEAPTNTTLTSPVPTSGNIQFNIGSGEQGKGVRRLRRPLRNMSRAFHK